MLQGLVSIDWVERLGLDRRWTLKESRRLLSNRQISAFDRGQVFAIVSDTFLVNFYDVVSQDFFQSLLELRILLVLHVFALLSVLYVEHFRARVILESPRQIYDRFLPLVRKLLVLKRALPFLLLRGFLVPSDYICTIQAWRLTNERAELSNMVLFYGRVEVVRLQALSTPAIVSEWLEDLLRL